MNGPSGRLLTLLSLLQVRRDWPGSTLADRLAVSDRTVRRDIDRLRELGYSVVVTKGPEGGYRLEAGAEMPPLLFDDEQAVALAVALQLAATANAGVEQAAVRALTTVRQVLPAHLRHQVDAVQFSSIPAPAAGVDAGVLIALSRAARNYELVSFTYDGKANVRRAEPYRVIYRNQRWYVLAWDLDRNDWRTYRLDRLVLANGVGHRFTPRAIPGGDLVAFVDGKFKGRSDAGGWPCQGKVTMHVPTSAIAPYVLDGTIEVLDDVSCKVSIGAWSWVALAASLARFDAAMSAAEPQLLQQAFSHLATRSSVAAR